MKSTIKNTGYVAILTVIIVSLVTSPFLGYVAPNVQNQHSGKADAAILPTVAACTVDGVDCSSPAGVVTAVPEATAEVTGLDDFIGNTLDFNDRVEENEANNETTESFVNQISIEQDLDGSIYRENLRREIEGFQSIAETEADKAIYEAYENNKSTTEAVLAGRTAINDTADVIAQGIQKSHNDLALTPALNKKNLAQFNRSDDILTKQTPRVVNVTTNSDFTNINNDSNPVRFELQNNISINSFEPISATYDGKKPIVIDGNEKTIAINGSYNIAFGSPVDVVFRDVTFKNHIDYSRGFEFSTPSESNTLNIRNGVTAKNGKIDLSVFDGSLELYDNTSISYKYSNPSVTTNVSTPERPLINSVTFDPADVSSSNLETTVDINGTQYTARNKTIAGNTYKFITPYDSSGNQVLSPINLDIPDSTNVQETSATYIQPSKWNDVWSLLDTELQAALTQAGSTSSGYLLDTYDKLQTTDDGVIPEIGNFNYNVTPEQLNQSPKVSALIKYYPNFEGHVRPTESDITLNVSGEELTGDLYTVNASKVGIQNNTWSTGETYDFTQSQTFIATDKTIAEINSSATVSDIKDNGSSVTSIENRDGYAQYNVQSIEDEWGAYQDAVNKTNEVIKVEIDYEDGGSGPIFTGTGSIVDFVKGGIPAVGDVFQIGNMLVLVAVGYGGYYIYNNSDNNNRNNNRRRRRR